MTVPAVQELTGIESSHAILAALSRDHFFTERHVSTDIVYQYHPLFREFLLFRAERVHSAGTADRAAQKSGTAAGEERTGRTGRRPAVFRRAHGKNWPG